MPLLLFKLHNVPDAEAEEVRSLLEEANLAFYETSSGRWRLGVDAIWLEHQEDEAQARALLAEYQRERTRKAREEQQQLEDQGLADHFLNRLQTRPSQVLLTLLGILAVLFVFFLPLVVLLSAGQES